MLMVGFAPAPTTVSSRNQRDRGGPQQPLLLVQDLRKHFKINSFLFAGSRGRVHAVDDISFEIGKGETLGVVGESGCGKSTTARVLMRLLEPDAGEVIFDGETVGARDGISLRELRRDMQMVFQDSYASLNPRLPIAETVAFSPRVHGLGRRQAQMRARSLLDRVGLAPDLYARRYPHELSGGQRQRVNIARALALEPRLVILDEAVSALDKSVEAQVLNLLMDLKAELGLTYMFISHDLNVVQYLSDRVMVMYLGKVVEIGEVAAIYDDPRHPYTRALLSAMPSMNPDQRTAEAPLIGDPPNPINPPSGCRFRTRCAFSEAVCETAVPELKAPEPGVVRSVACHMSDPATGHSRAGASIPLAWNRLQ
jgi:peptide/nickel transport system ATP-binding protein